MKALKAHAAPIKHSKTVFLRSGGHVTVSGHFDLFTASHEDRQLVEAFADLMFQYERAAPEDPDAATGTADDNLSPEFVEAAREYLREPADRDTRGTDK